MARGRSLVVALSIAATLASGSTASAQVEEAEPALDSPPLEAPIDETAEEAEPSVVELLEEHVAVHGFGFWAGGVTNENEYLFGTEDVDLGHVAFAPRILAVFGPSLKMATGFELLLMHGGEVEVELDFAYAEWRPMDQFAVLVGRTIFPHGYYTPFFAAPTLRPFGALPVSVYGPVGAVAEGLNGLILEYESQNAGGFNVRIDGWVGQVGLEVEETPLRVYQALPLPPPDRVPLFAEHQEEEEENVRIAGGAVLTLLFATPGLEVELGAYGGQILEEPEDLTLEHEKSAHVAALAGVSYVGNELELHAEYVFHADADELVSHGAYLEAAYRLTEHWQVAARGEIFAFEADGLDEDAIAPSFDEHRSAAVGLNYWYTRDFVLKASYQYVNGNFFAFPEHGSHLIAAVLANDFERHTHYGELSAGFSF